MTRILAVGATGTIGRQVVSQLAARGAQVRALARNPDAPSMPRHVETVRGDLTVPETLDAALAGVDAVFLVWIAPPATIGAVVERIAKHARRIVFLSAPIKTQHPLFQQPNPVKVLHEQIERAISGTQLQWTILRPGMFAANALNWWAPQIRAGNIVRWPYLDVPTAPIDERDIATVAARALCDAAHTAAECVLTGPQSLTQREQLDIIGRALDRKLQIEEFTPDQARRELTSIVPLPAVNMLLNAWAAAAGQPAHVTTTFTEITGAPPRTFQKWATDNATAFRA